MLPIHEQFYTFQGEGAHAGRAAYFIRTFGCPVHCPWCDSAGTWHTDYIPDKVERFAVDTLVAEVVKTKAEFVVVTGGEPAIHDLAPLVDALHKIGRAVHLETSGAFKIIVDQDGAIPEYVNVIGRTNKPVWLHPEWSKHSDIVKLDTITEWVKAKGAPYRAGWQMHKNYAADLKDARSAPAVPLGGDSEKGF